MIYIIYTCILYAILHILYMVCSHIQYVEPIHTHVFVFLFVFIYMSYICILATISAFTFRTSKEVRILKLYKAYYEAGRCWCCSWWFTSGKPQIPKIWSVGVDSATFLQFLGAQKIHSFDERIHEDSPLTTYRNQVLTSERLWIMSWLRHQAKQRKAARERRRRMGELEAGRERRIPATLLTWKIPIQPGVLSVV